MSRTYTKYKDTNGWYCPFCDSSDIVGFSVTIESGSAYQKTTCADCEKDWTDEYRLHGYYHEEEK